MKQHAQLFGKKAEAHRVIAQLHKAKAEDVNTGRGDLKFHKALADQHEALARAEEQHQELCRGGATSDKVAKSTFGDDLMFDHNLGADANELNGGCGL